MPELDVQKRLITAVDYHEMGRQGILRPDERVELIHGELIVREPQGPLHASCVRRLTKLFARRLFEHDLETVEVSVQLPFLASAYDVPEPDLALTRAGDFTDHHPSGPDVLLAVEVSVTTLSYDRQIKVPLFAASGLAEVWIVNYAERRLEVFRVLRDGRYLAHSSVGPADEVTIDAFPELGRFRVAEILG